MSENEQVVDPVAAAIEACAKVCEELAVQTRLGRDTINAKRMGRIRHNAFMNAAEVIRKLKLPRP
jgi:hypothetical protein